MAESYGWAGKILRVNLTTGEITTQDDEKYHKYIGGMGMAYRIMYEEAPMELDPYDEKALVIFGIDTIYMDTFACQSAIRFGSFPKVIEGTALQGVHQCFVAYPVRFCCRAFTLCKAQQQQEQ